MEIKEMIDFYRKNIKMVAISVLLAGVLGFLAYYFLPLNYQAAGSLFVKRVIYPYSETHFTYEGYYGQQAAVSYTDSIIGLVESIDVRARSLQKLGSEINDENLRQLSRKTRISKSGPQVITIHYKERTPAEAQAGWQAVADTTIETVGELKSGGDPYLNLAKVSQEPVVKEGYRNLPLFVIAGLLSGLVLSSFLVASVNYFTKKKK